VAVGIPAECLFNGLQVWLVGIRGDLRTVNYAVCAVKHEIGCPSGIPSTHEVGDAQFGIGIKAHPGPRIAPTRRLLLWCCVLVFRAYKLPNFITLQAMNAQAANVSVMEFSARTPQIL
jgi:hypothetical protein